MHEFNETYFDKCIHTIAAYNVVARDNETDCIEEQAIVVQMLLLVRKCH